MRWQVPCHKPITPAHKWYFWSQQGRSFQRPHALQQAQDGAQQTSVLGKKWQHMWIVDNSLPPPHPVCMCAGLAVTSATVVIFGTAVRDPVQLLSQLQQPAAVCLALFGEC